MSPLSGSRDASADTQISFLGVLARALSHLDVRGSSSGEHSGRLLAYSQGDGASFVPTRPLPTNTFATNFGVEEYLGKPALTWWQGDISVHGFGLGEGVIAHQSYTDIAHVRAGNGVQADLHDFQLTPQGAALVTAYQPILCDLSSVGGSSYDGVTDGLLQEIDVKTGLVMFQWSSLDHVGLGESYAKPGNTSTAAPFDYFHINSINVDHDGSLLISARNTWTAYDLDDVPTHVVNG
jgi:hypothetical protein